MTAGPAAEPVPGAPPGRAAQTISQLYYYVAAAVGVAFVIGGTIGLLFGLRTLVLPGEFNQPGDGLRTMLHGLAFALPGLGVAWWHLREARRREEHPPVGTFWGRSLYFHLVAFVALWFAVGGVITGLSAAVDAAVPRCFGAVATPVPEGEVEVEVPPEGRQCYPEPEDAARRVLDGAIFLLVGGPVWWWHLRQGRRATEPPPSPVPAGGATGSGGQAAG